MAAILDSRLAPVKRAVSGSCGGSTAGTPAGGALWTIFEPRCSLSQLEKTRCDDDKFSKVPTEDWIVNLIAVDATPTSFNAGDAEQRRDGFVVAGFVVRWNGNLSGVRAKAD